MTFFRRKEPDLNKEIADTKKKLDKLQRAAKGKIAPPAVPPPKKPDTTEAQGEVSSLAEFPIGQKIDVEFTRIKETKDETHYRVIQSRGRASIKVGGFGNKDPKKFLFVVVGKSAYYINPKKIISVTDAKGKKTFKLVFDILYGEALNLDGKIEWDPELEMLLADSGLDQYVSIAAFEGGFQFTPTLKKVMVILSFLGFILGLAINGAAHVIPTTIIHWIPG